MTSLSANMPRLAAALQEGIDRGLHRGAQIFVWQNDAVVADDAIGTSHDDVPLSRDTLMPWLSAGKPLTAACVLRLIESGQIELNTPVAGVIPEFAETSGDVTLFHLLTHTAGIEPVSTGWPQTPWEDVIATICRAGLRERWTPGERAAYDPVRSWFLLGEIARRLDGRPIEVIVREDLMRPLGMHDSWLAMPDSSWEKYGNRIGRTFLIKPGEQEPTNGHTRPYCTTPSPGASCRGPIRELGLFYRMLLAGGVTPDGERLLSEETVRSMTRRQREGMYDETFLHKLDVGLGVIVNSNRYGAATVPYGYGPSAGESAYGHGGARSCIAFADPQRDRVVALVLNGYPTEPQHHRRMRTLLDALETDLGDEPPP